MSLKTTALLACAILGYFIYQQQVRVSDLRLNRLDLSRIHFHSEPEQVATHAPEFTHKNHRIKPLARFVIRARVLSTEHYSIDTLAAISPVDLALAWGRLAEPDKYTQLTVSQSGRWYHYRFEGEPPLPLSELSASSSNMHMIPANESVERILKGISKHDMVRLKGFLVEVKSEDGWTWRSSMSRTDTGDGACEVVFVEAIDIEAK